MAKRGILSKRKIFPLFQRGAGGIKGLAVLGSTGSIGRHTLDVVRSNPDKFYVVSLAAGRNIALLKSRLRSSLRSSCRSREKDAASWLKRSGLKTGFGVTGACDAATFDGVDKVISAIVGAAGFCRPTRR